MDADTISRAADVILMDVIYEDITIKIADAEGIARRLLSGEKPRNFPESVWLHNLRVEGFQVA